MPICRQSITNLNLSQGSIDCQFNANALPINVKYSTFSAANHPNPCQSGFFIKSRDWRISTGLADWRRLTEIGYHCRARVKPPMQCQCANPGRIRCQSRAHFGLAKSRQSMVHRGQSCAIPIPIRYQSRLRPKHCMLPIQYQSNANPLSMPGRLAMLGRQSIANPSPIQYKSIVNRCQSSPNLMPMRCQSDANPMSTEVQSSANPFQSDANPVPIQCQSNANPVPIHSNLVPIKCQPNANPTTTRCRSGANPASICCQFDANPSPIHRQSIPISCQSVVNARPPRNARPSIHCQSIANPVPIHRQSMSIQSQSDANTVSI